MVGHGRLVGLHYTYSNLRKESSMVELDIHLRGSLQLGYVDVAFLALVLFPLFSFHAFFFLSSFGLHYTDFYTEFTLFTTLYRHYFIHYHLYRALSCYTCMYYYYYHHSYTITTCYLLPPPPVASSRSSLLANCTGCTDWLVCIKCWVLEEKGRWRSTKN